MDLHGNCGGLYAVFMSGPLNIMAEVSMLNHANPADSIQTRFLWASAPI
jgi:hypothetical protein